ncbi:MAG: hypothetical protein ACTSRP_08695 [Candidatus Helarchaeota archaeon]
MTNSNSNELKWYIGSIKKDNYTINAAMTKLDNAIIFVLSTNGYKFGSLSIALPSKYRIGIESFSSPIAPISFGRKNELITKAIGERISYKTNQLVISMVNIDFSEKEIYKECNKLIDELLSQMKKDKLL